MSSQCRSKTNVIISSLQKISPTRQSDNSSLAAQWGAFYTVISTSFWNLKTTFHLPEPSHSESEFSTLSRWKMKYPAYHRQLLWSYSLGILFEKVASLSASGDAAFVLYQECCISPYTRQVLWDFSYFPLSAHGCLSHSKKAVPESPTFLNQWQSSRKATLWPADKMR